MPNPGAQGLQALAEPLEGWSLEVRRTGDLLGVTAWGRPRSGTPTVRIVGFFPGSAGMALPWAGCPYAPAAAVAALATWAAAVFLAGWASILRRDA